MSREVRAADTQHGQQTPSEGSVRPWDAWVDGRPHREVEARGLPSTKGIGLVGTGADSAALIALGPPGLHRPWGALKCSLPAGNSAVQTS